jgi:TPR repeat protein
MLSKFNAVAVMSGASVLCLRMHSTCIASADQADSNPSIKKKPSKEVKVELSRIRLKADEIRERWIKDEENWRKLPARAWPEVQPDADDVPRLQSLCDKLCSSPSSGGSPQDMSACHDVTFHLATALLFNNLNVEKGLAMFESLAEKGDVRGTTAAGICYVEGLGVTYDEEKGSRFIQHAADKDFLQGIYELGVLHYNGNATPYVDENMQKAFRLFELAASRQHTSGLYMTADMLLTGEGCGEKDEARAIRLLYEAGERGHRNARATLWALLREYE